MAFSHPGVQFFPIQQRILLYSRRLAASLRFLDRCLIQPTYISSSMWLCESKIDRLWGKRKKGNEKSCICIRTVIIIQKGSHLFGPGPANTSSQKWNLYEGSIYFKGAAAAAGVTDRLDIKYRSKEGVVRIATRPSCKTYASRDPPGRRRKMLSI